MQTTQLRCSGLRLPGRQTALRASRTSTAIRAAMPIDRPSGGGARFPLAAANSAPAANTAAAPAVQPVAVSGEVSVTSVVPPAAIYQRAVAMGEYKANIVWWRIVLLGIMAGFYVALGGALLLTVGPNCTGIAASNPGLARYITGAIGFPYALLIILTCGAELFTGNTALVAAAVYEKKANLKQLAKSWICSYAGNAIGCALGVLLFLNMGLDAQFANGAQALATSKVAYPLKETFLKAIAANSFVVLAVWQSIAAQSFGGKFIACLGPVSAFVCCGFEHCIANMLFIPFGMFLGAQTTWKQFFFSNLIPVTLGNIIAGAVIIAGAYSLIYGRLGKVIDGTA